MTIKTSEALDGKLTISRPICSDGSEYVSISVLDEDSNINFLNIQIGYSDFTKCLMGLSRVDCELSTRGLDKVGLYLRTRKISVEMPPNIEYHDHKQVAYKLCCEAAPSGWVVDNYFGSKTSFIDVDGMEYAVGIMRKWVDKNLEIDVNE